MQELIIRGMILPNPRNGVDTAMIDFSEMSGYEFEDFISVMLKEKGFRVTQTDYSNDGGIDIVAELDIPLLKGKYIVQCKKWSGNVGQPEIRDLYGVVTSERANKGILISTSDFTEQAYSFAEGKNIELINGDTLALLLQNSQISDSKPQDTLELKSSFNQERYDYLVKSHSDVMKSQEGYSLYHELMTFLWDYFWEDNIAVCKDYKIFDKIIDISKKTAKKIINRKKMYSYYTNCKFNLFNAYIVTGQLYEATTILLDDKEFYLDAWWPRKAEDGEEWWSHGRFSLTDSGVRYCPKLQTRHLFSAYKLVGYEKGRREMLRYEGKINCSDSDIVTSAEREITFADFRSEEERLFYEDAVKEREKVLSGFYDDVFFHSSKYHGDNRERLHYTSSCSTDYATFKSLSFIKENYYQEDDNTICEMIDKAFREHGMELKD